MRRRKIPRLALAIAVGALVLAPSAGGAEPDWYPDWRKVGRAEDRGDGYARAFLDVTTTGALRVAIRYQPDSGLRFEIEAACRRSGGFEAGEYAFAASRRRGYEVLLPPFTSANASCRWDISATSRGVALFEVWELKRKPKKGWATLTTERVWRFVGCVRNAYLYGQGQCATDSGATRQAQIAANMVERSRFSASRKDLLLDRMRDAAERYGCDFCVDIIERRRKS